MTDESVITFFNSTYDDTYRKVWLYVSLKCHDINDIPDIVQEIYTEVFNVIQKKGIGYIQNAHAFVMKLAKNKVYKYYFSMKGLRNLMHFDSKGEPDAQEIEISDYTDDYSIDEKVVNKCLADDIWEYLNSKSDDIRKIFYLYYYLELTIPEISKVMSMGESNVKNKLFRTVKEIRRLYEKEVVCSE